MDNDPFWSEENQAELQRRIEELESGKAKLITVTMDELETMTKDDLEALLAENTGEYVPKEDDAGSPVGREVW